MTAVGADALRRYRRAVQVAGPLPKTVCDVPGWASTSTTFTEGNRYHQIAHELHASGQQPETATAIRCSWAEAPELTVCVRDEGSWRSGQGRDAQRQEIKSFTAKALEWF